MQRRHLADDGRQHAGIRPDAVADGDSGAAAAAIDRGADIGAAGVDLRLAHLRLSRQQLGGCRTFLCRRIVERDQLARAGRPRFPRPGRGEPRIGELRLGLGDGSLADRDVRLIGRPLRRVEPITLLHLGALLKHRSCRKAETCHQSDPMDGCIRPMNSSLLMTLRRTASATLTAGGSAGPDGATPRPAATTRAQARNTPMRRPAGQRLGSWPLPQPGLAGTVVRTARRCVAWRIL
ncbi:hypothetical protein GCM10011504_36880 [Siccirubricoccus deserti]|nr:hypothetical protein GCM10011504_36880 [Siccirubricoccus deserti]